MWLLYLSVDSFARKIDIGLSIFKKPVDFVEKSFSENDKLMGFIYENFPIWWKQKREYFLIDTLNYYKWPLYIALFYFFILTISVSGLFQYIGLVTSSIIFFSIVVFDLLNFFMILFTFVKNWDEIKKMYTNSPFSYKAFCRSIWPSVVKGALKCTRLFVFVGGGTLSVYEVASIYHKRLFPDDTQIDEITGKYIKDKMGWEKGPLSDGLGIKDDPEEK